MFPKIKPSKKTIYLDHAATTPLNPEVKKAMEPFWIQHFGNPSSLYKQGREAREALHGARSVIAGVIGARPSEIVFTAGGTESVNAAILGVARAALRQGKNPHIITVATEHHSVLHSVKEAKEEGCSATYVGVNAEGFVELEQLKKAVRPETVLISVMYANNEIGTIQPIAKIGSWISHLNVERIKRGLPRVYFHTDACQVMGVLDVNVNRLGVDLFSANGSKIYGPKQTGFLFVRMGTPLRPIMHGGGQERDIRSGTENVPGIVGLAEAVRRAEKLRNKENARLMKLRSYFMTQLHKRIPRIILNGPVESGVRVKLNPKKEELVRLPNNINISVVGVEGESLMLYLDSYNVAVSTGSACTSTSTDPSHVLLALGRTEAEAQSSIRFTLGTSTTKQDLDFVLKILPSLVEELRRVTV